MVCNTQAESQHSVPKCGGCHEFAEKQHRQTGKGAHIGVACVPQLNQGGSLAGESVEFPAIGRIAETSRDCRKMRERVG